MAVWIVARVVVEPTQSTPAAAGRVVGSAAQGPLVAVTALRDQPAPGVSRFRPPIALTMLAHAPVRPATPTCTINCSARIRNSAT